MITELPESSGPNIGFLVKGKLTYADFKENLIPVMDAAIKSHGKIRILFQIEDVEGMTAHGAWDDIMTWPKLRFAERMGLVSNDEKNKDGNVTETEYSRKFFIIFSKITHIDVRDYSRHKSCRKPGNG